jgi:hypothetical protein
MYLFSYSFTSVTSAHRDKIQELFNKLLFVINEVYLNSYKRVATLNLLGKIKKLDFSNSRTT